MKFGKEFKKQMVPEWTEAYMDYNGLKSSLHDILRYKQSKQPAKPLRSFQQKLAMHRTFSGLNREPSNLSSRGDIEDQVIDVNPIKRDDSAQFYKTEFLRQSEGGEIEVAFFSKLDEELNKVNNFYKDKVEDVVNEASLLNKQMDALIALRIMVENPDIHGSSLMKHPSADINLRSSTLGSEREDVMPEENKQGGSIGGLEVNPVHTSYHINDCKDEEKNTTGSSHDPLRILEGVKLNNTLESPLSTIKGILKDSKDDDLSFKKDELRKAEEQLRLVFIEFYQKLRLLKHYSIMNLSAFSKIMKKYEKITSRRASRSYMKTVDNSYIGSCDEINNLLERVEVTFIKHFSNSNRREGMKSLRPKTKREKHSVTFLSGFFAGCAIALIVGVVLRIETKNLMDKEEGTSYMVNIFPLYSIFAYIILHMLTYTADLYFWRRYRVNYPFIFGFKQGSELSYREVFLLSTSLAVLSLASFLANLHLNLGSKPQNYKTLTEIFPLGLVTIVLAIMFCPFDVLYRASRFFFIQSLFHCICAPLYKVTLPDFFLADHLTSQFQAIRSLDLYICYYGLGELSRRENKCHSHGVYNAFYFVIAVIPYWIRFLQCLRRLCEDRDPMHGYNSLKYLSTIVAVLIRTACELKKGKSWMVFALVSSAVATIVNTYWDIVIDWGLLRRHSNNTFLRDKLLVPHKSIYFAAMVLNIVLRIAWMQLVLEFNLPSLHKMAVTTTISCLEIIRRGIWSFFRLENEHLNNVGKFRAFKSVPLPFSYNDEENDKGD